MLFGNRAVTKVILAVELPRTTPCAKVKKWEEQTMLAPVLLALAIIINTVPANAYPMCGMRVCQLPVPATTLQRVKECKDPACMDVYSACIDKLKPGEKDTECLQITIKCQDECAKK
jgi:hypothetical protein